MTPEEIQKLLGGYATGTLTPAEQQALFEAALHDQELFDALAKEQPLHDLLRDPAARAYVLSAIEERPRRWWQLGSRWALVGATLAAGLVGAGVYWNRSKPVPAPVLVAELKPQELPRPVAPPVPAPPAAAPASTQVAVHKSAQSRPVKVSPAAPQTASRQSHAPAARVPAAAPTDAPSPGPVATAVASPAAAPAVEVAPTAAVVAAVKQPVDANDLALAKAETKVQNARALFYAAPGALQGGAAGSQFFPTQPPVQQAPKFAMQAGVASVVFAPNLGVKWTALRKNSEGLFREVDPERIKAGDTIKLRLVPNDNGFLTVFDGTKPMMARQRTQRLQPIETPEITSDVGKKELTVTLARQAQPPATNLVRTGSVDQVSQTDRDEHAVYEVKMGSNQLAPVLVKITLIFR